MECSHTGKNVGDWLHKTHASVGCEPSFIGTVVVDGASNAGKSVERLEILTQDERSQKIVVEKCSAHKVNTTAAQSSGTSTHKYNVNENCGKSLTKLHTRLVHTKRSGTRMGVLKRKRKGNGRKKCHSIEFGNLTRWKSRHKETVCASRNQLDLQETWVDIISEDGIDSELYAENVNDLSEVIPTEHDWSIWSQYASGMMCVTILCDRYQTAQVSFHMELFYAKACLESLAANFFPMHENLSQVIGSRGADLTKPRLNQLVKNSDIEFEDDDYEKKYVKTHEMVPEVQVARRAAWRLLNVRMGFMTRSQGMSKQIAAGIDMDITSSINSGLRRAAKLADVMIMGGILHPQFQGRQRMIAAGLCSDEQYEAGILDLEDRMTRWYESNDDKPREMEEPQAFHEYDEVDEVKSSPHDKLAEDELKSYMKYKHFKYLPEVEPKIVLGAIDEYGQPRTPTIALGPVKKRGKDLPSGKNHADYINKKGVYDIVKFQLDHKDLFPAVFHVGVGQLSSHLTSEVDCESLFSHAGHISDPLRSSTKVRTFERLVIAKHRLKHIYCCPKKVQKLYLRRKQANNWDEDEERDDQTFLDMEKKIYDKMFPHDDGVLGGDEDSNNEDDFEDVSDDDDISV